MHCEIPPLDLPVVDIVLLTYMHKDSAGEVLPEKDDFVLCILYSMS